MSHMPLGIADLFLDGDPEAPTVHETPDVWWWCRRHEQAHLHGKACRAIAPGGARAWVMPGRCIDIGPFMSEEEALRLQGHIDSLGINESGPLGMEIKR